MLHLLVVLAVPACLLAGWWQVHRALSGNLLSYFYSCEWPLFAVLGVVAWWQLLHDVPLPGRRAEVTRARRSWLHRDEYLPSPELVWDKQQETSELQAYNAYLKALAEGRARKTWRNPRGLPLGADE